MNTLLLKTWTLPLEIGGKYDKKLLINTINSHSYNVALNDPEFFNALMKSDILIPDGIGIVYALRFLYGTRIRKIAAYELLMYELDNLNKGGGKCFFLGSSEKVLNLISRRLAVEFPDIKVSSYSPPYKPVFTAEENNQMVAAVNSFSPDVLFVGMTAPKQEKWSAAHFEKLQAKHICSIGAVFDFYALTIKRAPAWMINLGLEWLYRLMAEPVRMWRRYVIGNPKFMWFIIKEKFKTSKN
jgi:N-acetylglucosaminyldiphosphoundecaprenol N-acetyl-beta-D-mannosaminyltransferase